MTDTVQDTAATVGEAQPEAKAAQAETWTDGSPFDAAKAKALIDKQRAEMKELKAKAIRAEELESELTKRKEAEMSELEKAQTKLKEAEQKAQAYELKELQRAAAEKVGLPAAFASRIQGNTAEDMEADAKLLLDAMPKAEDKKPPNISPNNPAQQQAGETEPQRRARLGMG